MPNLEELLAPIEGDLPAGPELRSSAEYAQVEGAFRSADIPPAVTTANSPGDLWGDFEAVVEPAKEFLQTRSKDLSVAAYLTASLLREEGFAGLADGLELIYGLLDRFWDGLHPGMEGRAAVLEWLGSDDVAYAIRLMPLTEFDPTLMYTAYEAWAKEQAQGGGSSGADEEGGGDFGSAFAQTPREWYVDLVTALNRCTVNLEAVVQLGQEKFKETGTKPPRLKAMAGELKKVTWAAQDLLSKKPGPPVPTAPEPPTQSGDASGDGAETGEGSPVQGVVTEPRNAAEATDLVILGARFLRIEMPWHPGSYLLIRGLRWGELKADGSHIDPRILEAPSTQQRTRLKGMFLDQDFEGLLHASEEVMASAVGRGWLDLQRYSVLSAERLGKSYRHVRNAVLESTAQLLRDVPDLLEMTLMDDSATASRDTVSWLEDHKLLPHQQEGRAGQEEPGAKDAQKVIKEASFDRAAAMARSGDPESAIELLMERAEHEPSERGRFITKAEAAGIMVEHGMISVARPILDELHQLIEGHRLEDWEPADIVAKPLGLLFSCLGEREEGVKQQLHTRLAKLDPLLAMELTQVGGGRRQSSAAIPSSPLEQRRGVAQEGTAPQAEPDEPAGAEKGQGE